MAEIAINPTHNVFKKYKEVIYVNPFLLGGVFDADAQAFITAATITETIQKSAINQLVIDLKSNGLWTKIKAIYPFVGGTEFTHKWNLKDPRDLDDAFRLVYNGSISHDSNGILATTATNSYANTFLVPYNHLNNDSTHMSIYSRTNKTSNDMDMGCQNGDSRRMITHLKFSDNNHYTDMYNSSNGRSSYSLSSTPSTGLFLSNRLSNVVLNTWRNGQKKSTQTSLNATILPTTHFYIGSSNSYLTATGRQFAYSSIGSGLTDAEALAYYNIIQAYQTSLNRQV